MGDKNNNLEDFLRRKFSDIEDSDEAWTRPSSMIKNDILEQITKPDQKKQRKKRLFFILFLGLLSSMIIFKCLAQFGIKEKSTINLEKIGGSSEKLNISVIEEYSNPLNNQSGKSEGSVAKATNVIVEASKDELIERNSLLRAVIQNQNEIITQLRKKDSNNSEEKVTEQHIEDKQLNEAFNALLKANDQLELKQKQLKELTRVQRKKIESLNNEKQLLLDSLNAQIYALNAEQKRDKEIVGQKNNRAFQNINPIVATGLKKTEEVIEPMNVLLEDNFGLNKPKRKVQFEVGYQLGARGKMTEVIEYVEEQGKITNQVKDKFLVSHVHGLSLGISPLKNFWIKTGAHIGNMNLHQKHNLAFIYNSNNPVTLSSGNYADMVADLSEAGINKLQENINGLANAVNGDQLNFSFQTNLVLTYLQIPLEFNYVYGKKRLQALFQLGGQWNRLNYQYYLYDFQTEVNNQNTTSVNQKSVKRSNEFSLQYWGLHAGVGLSYKISKHLNIQGLLSYEYYFLNNINGLQSTPSQAYAQPPQQRAAKLISNMGFGLKVGLNYRF